MVFYSTFKELTHLSCGNDNMYFFHNLMHARKYLTVPFTQKNQYSYKES